MFGRVKLMTVFSKIVEMTYGFSALSEFFLKIFSAIGQNVLGLRK